MKGVGDARAVKSRPRAEARQYGLPFRGGPIAQVITLPRKPAKLHPRGTRTANRHRWPGREYRGVELIVAKELGKLAP